MSENLDAPSKKQHAFDSRSFSYSLLLLLKCLHVVQVLPRLFSLLFVLFFSSLSFGSLMSFHLFLQHKEELRWLLT